jgi:prepilin-type N-terminal cleavage/methylation domain-containing protein
MTSRHTHRCDTTESSRAAGFSLIELIVAISIILLLIGILLPVLGKARRVAMVMACPVVYADQNHVVWLTDLEGRKKIQISNTPAPSFEPIWSPDGQRLAWWSGGNLIINSPASGDEKSLPYAYQNFTWLDRNTILSWHYPDGMMVYINANTGAVTDWQGQTVGGNGPGYMEVCVDPHFADGFIIAESENFWTPQLDIVIRDRNWRLTKTVWKDPGNDHEDLGPAIDPTGQWIAWTRGRNPGVVGPSSVAIKHISAHADQPPQMVGNQHISVVFCDWIDDEQFLAGVFMTTHWNLVIMDRSGEIHRTLPTAGLRGDLTIDNALSRAHLRQSRHY